jgi:hypothetical protein
VGVRGLRHKERHITRRQAALKDGGAMHKDVPTSRLTQESPGAAQAPCDSKPRVCKALWPSRQVASSEFVWRHPTQQPLPPR